VLASRAGHEPAGCDSGIDRSKSLGVMEATVTAAPSRGVRPSARSSVRPLDLWPPTAPSGFEAS
jgi:hypothetical protein